MKLAAAVALAIVLVASPASATPKAVGLYSHDAATPVTLFFHQTGFQDFPINTQEPPEWFDHTSGLGLATASLSCVGEGTNQPLVQQEYSTYYGFSSPSYVEYDVAQDGQPRIHSNRGYGYDVQWDVEKGILLHWFMESQVTPGNPNPPAPDPQVVPVPLPNVSVQATMRSGDSISINDIGYDSGPILAQGRSAPMLLAPNAAVTPGYFMTEDGRHVYEFLVPMEIEAPVIPETTGFNLRVDVFIDNPLCSQPQDRYLMANSLRVHTSAGHRSRMELTIYNPLVMESFVPMFIGDQVIVRATLNSPWGNYDVDESPGGIVSVLTGPDGAPVAGYTRANLAQRYHEHYYQTVPVEATYFWNYTGDAAPPGRYTVTFQARNDQHTATASAVSTFDIGAFETNGCQRVEQNSTAVVECDVDVYSDLREPKMPGPEFVLLLAGVAAAVALARRRA